MGKIIDKIIGRNPEFSVPGAESFEERAKQGARLLVDAYLDGRGLQEFSTEERVRHDRETRERLRR